MMFFTPTILAAAALLLLPNAAAFADLPAEPTLASCFSFATESCPVDRCFVVEGNNGDSVCVDNACPCIPMWLGDRWCDEDLVFDSLNVS